MTYDEEVKLFQEVTNENNSAGRQYMEYHRVIDSLIKNHQYDERIDQAITKRYVTTSLMYDYQLENVRTAALKEIVPQLVSIMGTLGNRKIGEKTAKKLAADVSTKVIRVYIYKQTYSEYYQISICPTAIPHGNDCNIYDSKSIGYFKDGKAHPEALKTWYEQNQGKHIDIVPEAEQEYERWMNAREAARKAREAFNSFTAHYRHRSNGNFNHRYPTFDCNIDNVF